MKNIIKYNYIGIRGTDELLQVGEMLTTSYLWNHEFDCSSYDTDEPVELGGVCAVDTMINGSTVEHIDWRYAGESEREELFEELKKQIHETIEFAKNTYCYNYYYIIGSEEYTDQYWSDDNREIHLVDAVVIEEI